MNNASMYIYTHTQIEEGRWGRERQREEEEMVMMVVVVVVVVMVMGACRNEITQVERKPGRKAGRERGEGRGRWVRREGKAGREEEVRRRLGNNEEEEWKKEVREEGTERAQGRKGDGGRGGKGGKGHVHTWWWHGDGWGDNVPPLYTGRKRENALLFFLCTSIPSFLP